MKKSLKLIALLTALICLAGLCACSGSDSAATAAPTSEAAAPEAPAAADPADADPDVFILGLDDSFPPMGYRNENDEIVGFDIDVAKAVCEKLGWTLELQPIDWETKEMELDQGNIDCIWNGFTITPEREEALDFSDPYISNDQVLVVMSDSELKTPEDAAGCILVTQAGSSSVDALDANAEFKSSLATVNEVNDFALALMELEQGTADVVLMDSLVANYYIGKESKDYRLLEGNLAGEEMGIGFRTGSSLRDQVNQCLKELKADGTLARISTDWFGSDVTLIEAE